MRTRTRNISIAAASTAAVAAIAAVLLTTGVTHVSPAEDLQAAINSAQCGAVIELDAGAAYRVNLILPKKDCTEYITIQSSRVSELPEGRRIDPVAQSTLFAKLQGSTAAEPIIKTTPGANHYRFIGVEVSTESETTVVYDLVRLGDSRQVQKTLDSVPHHISFDRSYIHGFTNQDVQRGISMQCAECEITNSWISDIHMIGVEAQGIAGWNGPGPFHIINNEIQSSTQAILFGGADSAIAELAPSNAEIRRNHLFKPLSWKVGDPSYAGKHWTVKNILEFKSCKDCVVDGNFLENNWVDAQSGIPVLLTVRNQECTAPWSTVQRSTFTNNTIKNADGGLNFLGKDNEAEASFGKCPLATGGSTRGTDALILNNLFYEIRGPFVTINGFPNVTLQNNTSIQQANLVTFYGEQSNGFKLLNHLTIDHDYSIFGDGGTMGEAALNRYAPGWAMNGCAIAGPRPGSNYPQTGNQFPASLSLPDDFRSPFPGIGADIDKLNAAQSDGSQPSVPSPSATATVTVSPTPAPTSTVAPSPSVTPTPRPSPNPTSTPTPVPLPSPSPSPTPSTCPATSWPSSIQGQNAKMAEQRALGCYPFERTSSGMRYVRR